MIKRFLILNICLVSSMIQLPGQGIADKAPIDYVNTRIGTNEWTGQSTLSQVEKPIGYVYPGVGMPFAMTQWTPQTNLNGVAYSWDDTKIQGFRASHYPNGASMSEYGALTVMPMVGKLETDPQLRASHYSHQDEIASPHYYHVNLSDYGIKAEITSGSKTGFLKFTFPESEQSHIVIDNPQSKKGSYFKINPDKNEIEGFITAEGRVGNKGYVGREFACYFVARFSKSFESYGVKLDSDGNLQDISGERVLHGMDASSAYVTFKTGSDEVVEVKVGTSFINMVQARKNLENESALHSFESFASEVHNEWDKTLNKIQIESSDENKEIFYTALQRCFLLPRNITEDGYHYSAFNGKIMPGIMYTDFSLWDTFRSLHPLLVFLEPDRVNDMIEALLNSYDEGGWIPKWPSPGYSNIMHGTHGDAVIADAYIKGIRKYDEDKAMEAMMKNATTPSTGIYVARVGISDFIELGYVPTDKYGESAIRTLEFSYDDYCIAQVAKERGEYQLYEELMKRSKNYINILDPETKMVRGRNSDGSWRDAKDPSISSWAQGSDKDRETYFRNITLFVPHDVQGLVDFMGGPKQFESYLDYFFENDFYYVGDEFSMHSPYLYNYVNRPWKTQKLIRSLVKSYFTNEPGGLPGNEDCGQMSSWYIFGAMGFYPTCPGNPIYQIGSPSFDKVTIDLGDGKKFIIEAKSNSDKNVYIQSATLNGKPYNKSWIHHDDIINGGTLVFKMGDKPNKKWGASL